MGVVSATLPLADAIDRVQTFVVVFVYVYALLMFCYILTSWIRVPYSLMPIQRFLHDVCEPYLRLFRRFLPPLGPLDLSPMIALIVLLLLERVVTTALNRLH